MRFQDGRAIIEVLVDAYAEGVKTFMCTTHERMTEICDFFRANRDKYPDYVFYPCMPYAHKYANAAAELGMVGAVRSFLPEENKLGALLRGGMSLARQDVEGLARLLIDAEMKMFAGLNTPVIFPAERRHRLSARPGLRRGLQNFRDLGSKGTLQRRTGLHHHECALVAEAAGERWDRESHHLRQHQQDCLPDVRRHAGPMRI